ncbi:MAG: transglycosylase SLT domain-containing protein [Micromonosporaceae bacterium]
MPSRHRRLSKLRPHALSIALGVVFVVVLTGVALGPTLRSTGETADAAAPSVATADDRSQAASRDMVRTAPATVTPTPTPAAAKPSPTKATTAPKPAVPAGCQKYTGNRRIGCSLLPAFGFSTAQMPALDKLWTHESNWNERARNPSSGAYGIPQALPATKLATAGADWRTNPATQIKWGLSYIKARYGTPSNTWAFWQAHNWY